MVATSASTAAQCPCWDAAGFAVETFTACTEDDLRPSASTDGVDETFTISSAGATFTVATSEDAHGDFTYCEVDSPAQYSAYMNTDQHAACLDLVQGAVTDAGLTCSSTPSGDICDDLEGSWSATFAQSVGGVSLGSSTGTGATTPTTTFPSGWDRDRTGRLYVLGDGVTPPQQLGPARAGWHHRGIL